MVLEPKNSFDFNHGFKKNAATFFLQLDGYFGYFFKGFLSLGFCLFFKALKEWIELN